MATHHPRLASAVLALLCSLAPLGLAGCGDEAEDPPGNFESEKNSPDSSDSLPDTRTTLSGTDESDGDADGVTGD